MICYSGAFRKAAAPLAPFGARFPLPPSKLGNDQQKSKSRDQSRTSQALAMPASACIFIIFSWSFINILSTLFCIFISAAHLLILGSRLVVLYVRTALLERCMRCKSLMVSWSPFHLIWRLFFLVQDCSLNSIIYRRLWTEIDKTYWLVAVLIASNIGLTVLLG